eukprot:8395737-Ditylum_brightwellii.AAC.1
MMLGMLLNLGQYPEPLKRARLSRGLIKSGLLNDVGLLGGVFLNDCLANKLVRNTVCPNP